MEADAWRMTGVLTFDNNCRVKEKMHRASCLTLEINEFRCYEAKIEESEKAGSHRESNPGHLWLEPASALPLSHNSRTTTSPHNPLYVLHKWY